MSESHKHTAKEVHHGAVGERPSAGIWTRALTQRSISSTPQRDKPRALETLRLRPVWPWWRDVSGESSERARRGRSFGSRLWGTPELAARGCLLMGRPSDMSKATWERVAKLPPDKRDRVLERSAILIYQGGLAPEDADERALAEEGGVPTQRTLVSP